MKPKKPKKLRRGEYRTMEAAEFADWLADVEERKRQAAGPSPEAAKLLAKKSKRS